MALQVTWNANKVATVSGDGGQGPQVDSGGDFDVLGGSISTDENITADGDISAGDDITATGDVNAANVIASANLVAGGSIEAGAAEAIYFANRTSIASSADGKLEITNQAGGAGASVALLNVRFEPVTVLNLPASPVEGQRAFVTDSNAASCAINWRSIMKVNKLLI